MVILPSLSFLFLFFLLFNQTSSFSPVFFYCCFRVKSKKNKKKREEKEIIEGFKEEDIYGLDCERKAWERVEKERYQSNEVGGTGRIGKSSIASAAVAERSWWDTGGGAGAFAIGLGNRRAGVEVIAFGAERGGRVRSWSSLVSLIFVFFIFFPLTSALEYQHEFPIFIVHFQ